MTPCYESRYFNSLLGCAVASASASGPPRNTLGRRYGVNRLENTISTILGMHNVWVEWGAPVRPRALGTPLERSHNATFCGLGHQRLCLSRLKKWHLYISIFGRLYAKVFSNSPRVFLRADCILIFI